MSKELDFQKTLEDSFLLYAGYVAQQRAIPSVEDGLKYSARQGIFSQFYTGNLNSKPFKKGASVVGNALSLFYDHGDQAIYDMIVRMGKPWALRYPLEEPGGSVGSVSNATNHAAPRYLSIRLSALGESMFNNINKNTIVEWREGHEPKDKFPMLLPSQGFYNICNGASGIGVGLATSIPQFNLVEVNTAIIEMIKSGKEVEWSKIYCAPDFATGGTIINASEVEESLKIGKGKSCKIRGSIEYNEKKNTLEITEFPYSVYGDTIMGELNNILETNPSCGFNRIVDGSGKKPSIHIFLNKNANPERIMRDIYKNTSLQYYYGINMTMLEGNRKPKVFGWREALWSFIEHSRYVKYQELDFDYKKAKARLEVVEGLLIAIAHIEDVIQIIKASTNSIVASSKLKEKYNFTNSQVEAILEMKLQRLANLESKKLETEAVTLRKTCADLLLILESPELLDAEIIKDLELIKKKFGDSRRTRILNIEVNENDEPVEKKTLMVYITEKGFVYAQEADQVAIQMRGGKGSKIKVGEGDFIKETISATNGNHATVFTNFGRAYTFYLNTLPINSETHIRALLDFSDKEKAMIVLPYSKENEYDYVVMTTKNGIIKKTSIKDVLSKIKKGVAVITLKEGDTLSDVSFIKKGCELLLYTLKGNSIRISETDISVTNRGAMGVQGIKLDEGNFCLGVLPIYSTTKEVCSITTKGLIKRTNINQFSKASRATKGSVMHKLNDDETLAAAICISDEKSITAVSTTNVIKISLEQVPQTSKGAQGVSVMKDCKNITKLIL